MRTRTYFANVPVVALSVSLLCHLVLIAIYGKLVILEPSIFILSFEMAMFIGFIAFAIGNIVKLVRSK